MEYDTVLSSLGRNGPVFLPDEYTEKLVRQYYVYAVEEDLRLEEVSEKPSEWYGVRVNGEMLQEGTDYTTSLLTQPEQWSIRTYIIKKEFFEKEGNYRIVVESGGQEDAAAYSDMRGTDLTFTVDQTAPLVALSGLSHNGYYPKEQQTVTAIPTDDGGKLKSFQAIVLDSEGKPIRDENGKDISVRFAKEGEALDACLKEQEGKIIFTVPEGAGQLVQLVCADEALHPDGTTNECRMIFEQITVTGSDPLPFPADSPWVCILTATVFAVSAGVGLWFALIRRKFYSR